MLASAGLAVSAVFAIRVQASTWCYYTPSGICAQELMFFGNEDGEFIAAVVVVGLSGIVSLTWIVHLLRFRLPTLLRSCCAWLVDAELASPSSFGRALLGKARLLCTKRALDPDAHKIRDEYERQRLRRVRSFASKSCPFLILFLLVSTYNNFFARLENDDITLRKITWQYPSLLTPAACDSLNIMLAATWSWKLGTTVQRRYTYNKYWIIAGRFAQVTLFGNSPLTWLLNFIMFVADCMVMFAHGDLGGHEIYRELMVVFLVCVVSYILDQLQWSQAKSTVLVQKSNHAAALVQQALSCMCDAVPMLDADLRLAEPCPGLSALLLRNGPLMPGAQFTDFLSAEDAQRLRTCIRSHDRFQRSEEVAAAGGGLAAREAVNPRGFSGLCHVNLRGANNLELPVSLFYSCVRDGNGQATFLLGIRENHEEGRAPPAGAGTAAAPAPAAQEALAALPEVCATQSLPESSSAWSASGISADQGDPLCVWVDAASSGLRVLRSSLCFALLGGASGACNDLAEWLSIADFTKLCTGLDSGGPPSGQVHVRLHSPVGVVYKCRVSLHDAEGSVVAAQPVRIVFHIIGFSGRRREAQREGGAGREAARISASGRLGGAYRSSNTEALGRKSRRASRLDAELNVQLEGGMPIGPLLRGTDGELLKRFAEHKRLQEWLEDPVGFDDALMKAVRSSRCDGLTEAAAREVGTFTFKQPGSPSPPVCFTARVSLLFVSQDADASSPIRLGLRHVEWIRDAARPQGGGQPDTVLAQLAPRAHSVEPQLLGSSCTLAL